MRYVPVVAVLCMHAALAYGVCVSDGPDTHPTSQYILKGGTAFDKKTHLTWERCSVGQTWQDGKGCVGTVQGLTRLQAELLEQNGWRLPTIEELETLVSRNCTHPAINEEVFPGMDAQSLYYWSKTSSREASLDYLNFATGTVSADSDEEPFSVRLVHSGP